jgi:hypothetical protein
MDFRWINVASLLLLLGLSGVTADRAMGSAGPVGAARETPIERWMRLSPEQRERALDKLAPERRQRIEERIRQYEQLSPQERQALRERYDRFRQLPPQKQNQARALFRRFSALPADRRQALQHELRQLRSMPEADRRARVASEDFRNRFSPSDQQMLQDLTRIFNQTP